MKEKRSSTKVNKFWDYTPDNLKTGESLAELERREQKENFQMISDRFNDEKPDDTPRENLQAYLFKLKKQILNINDRVTKLEKKS